MKIKAKGITLVESAMFILVFGIALTGLFSVLLVGKEEVAALLNVRQVGRVALTPETVQPFLWRSLFWNPGNPCNQSVPYVGIHNGVRIALNPPAVYYRAAIPQRVCASYYYETMRLFAIPCDDGIYTVYRGESFWGSVEVSGNGRVIRVKIPVSVRNKTVYLIYSVNPPYVEQEQ